MIRPFIFSFFLFIPTLSFAEGIEITGFSRVSNKRLANESTPAAIWGGLAGVTGACTSTTETCNTCTAATTACNEQAINDNLLLRIDFKVTADVTGAIKAEIKDNVSHLNALALADGSGTYTKDSTGTLEIQWNKICLGYNSAACDNNTFSSEITITVGTATVTFNVTVHEPTVPYNTIVLCADAAPEDGICFFHAYPGDRKVYIQDLQTVGTYPTNNTVRFTGVRVFFSSVNWASAGYNGDTFADLVIPEGQDEPEPNVIEGLENDTTYFIRSAMIDEAKNITFLIDAASIDHENPACAAVADAGAGLDADCDMMATPSEVYGLLTEDLNCFISTAAYGSSMANEVQTFREFRNRFMIDSLTGKKLIKAYYNYGSQLSQKIYFSKTRRAIARILLIPPLWFAKASLKFGLIQASIASSILVLSLISLLGYGILRGRKKWLSSRA